MLFNNHTGWIPRRHSNYIWLWRAQLLAITESAIPVPAIQSQDSWGEWVCWKKQWDADDSVFTGKCKSTRKDGHLLHSNTNFCSKHTATNNHMQLQNNSLQLLNFPRASSKAQIEIFGNPYNNIMWYFLEFSLALFIILKYVIN